MSVSRVYADVISQMPEGYANYDTLDIKWQYVWRESSNALQITRQVPDHPKGGKRKVQ